MMTYKGYVGCFEIDEEAGVIRGRVLGIRDMITFEGTTVVEARQAFQDSVEDYLEFCAEMNRPPERPHSGKFNVRIPAELHRALAMLAEAQGKSLNDTVTELLDEGVRRSPLASEFEPIGSTKVDRMGRARPPRKRNQPSKV